MKSLNFPIKMAKYEVCITRYYCLLLVTCFIIQLLYKINVWLGFWVQSSSLLVNAQTLWNFQQNGKTWYRDGKFSTFQSFMLVRNTNHCNTQKDSYIFWWSVVKKFLFTISCRQYFSSDHDWSSREWELESLRWNLHSALWKRIGCYFHT